MSNLTAITQNALSSEALFKTYVRVAQQSFEIHRLWMEASESNPSHFKWFQEVTATEKGFPFFWAFVKRYL